MIDKINERWRTLKLIEEEDDNIETEDNKLNDGCNNWLVGKLLTNRLFKKDAMVGTMKAI
ncbi:hypothetical protein PTKIN_Ptkin04bG0107900 [Pterospermum kingtungense]